jgi:hypothetical protein
VKKRGLFLLILPVAAALGLFLVVRSFRPEPQPAVLAKRSMKVVRVVDGVEIVETVPVQVAPQRPKLRPVVADAPYVRPEPTDIAEAAEMARIQSTYQNFRTATLTANEELRKSLLAVLRRDGAAAVSFAREDAEFAETEADRAFALKLMAELNR